MSYDLPLASVHAAMTYYYDHREEIDRRTAESRTLVEELKRNMMGRIEYI
jgi:hypothetical protein